MAVDAQRPGEPSHAAAPTHRRSRRHVSGARVLGALVLVYAASPFFERTSTGEYIESAMITVLFCAAVLAVSARRRTLIVAMVLAVPAVVAKWANHARPDLVPAFAFLVPGILCLLYVLLHFMRYIMQARRVTADVLCTGLAAFFMLALAWAMAYGAVDRLIPGSFMYTAGPESTHAMRGFVSLYFSLVTLCTVGFGDIIPVSGPARMLAMFEGAAGVIFVAVFVSRLVSLYSAEHTEQPSEPPPR